MVHPPSLGYGATRSPKFEDENEDENEGKCVEIRIPCRAN
jgi:hypothetical protein